MKNEHLYHFIHFLKKVVEANPKKSAPAPAKKLRLRPAPQQYDCTVDCPDKSRGTDK